MRAISAALLSLAILSSSALAQELEVPEGGVVVSDDLSQLPPAVAEKRAALIAAASSGIIEALRPIFEAEPEPVTVSFGAPDDAVDYLKSQSADGDGLEILAILLDVLEAPFAIENYGGEFSYVWPYLASMEGIGEAAASDRIEGIRIAGVENFRIIQEFGVWIYWRIHIDADGHLTAFVAGD